MLYGVLLALLPTLPTIAQNPGMRDKIPAAEYAALVDFYQATGGPAWINRSGWLEPHSPNWYGVYVQDGHVVGLTVYENGLSGTIPASLANLSRLENLTIFDNRGLSGSIPENLGNLTSLKHIQFISCRLSGSIPASLGNLTQLQRLNLNGNHLTGNIPVSLGNLIQLWDLNLSANQLSGNIPASLSHLTQLQQLLLLNNQLSGIIPASLGDLTQLQQIALSQNKLSGGIPDSLGNLTSLRQLWLDNNHLGGSIPASLGNLSQLQILLLSYAELSGGIPATLGNLSQLQELFLEGNQLSEAIPASLGNLTRLRRLHLQNNQLIGTIPTSLGNLNQLQVMDLNDNRLSGSIPQSLGNLTRLPWLGLSNNQLSGSIPESLGNLTQLRGLLLANNQLSGDMPAFSAFRNAQVYVINNMLNISEGSQSLANINAIIARGNFVTYIPQRQAPITITVRDTSDQWNLSPSMEPSILRFPNRLAKDIPAMARRRPARLLKFTGAPDTQYSAFVEKLSAPGHDHGPEGWVHGWLSNKFSSSFPPFKFEPGFVSGGTDDYSTAATAFKITTDSSGIGRLYYYAPEISNREKIIITGAGASASVEIEVGVGLDLLSEPLLPLTGDIFDLTGKTSAHPQNHYGKPQLNAALSALALNWIAQRKIDPRSLPGPLLPVNDMSLIHGGVFDIDGKWSVDNGGHKGHRVGIEVDIGTSAAGFETFKPARKNGFTRLFNAMYEEQGWFTFLKEGVDAYYHFIVTGTGKIALSSSNSAAPATLVSASGEMKTSRFRLPVQNRGGIAAQSAKLTAAQIRNGILSGAAFPIELGPIEIGQWALSPPIEITTSMNQERIGLTWSSSATGADGKTVTKDCFQFVRLPPASQPVDPIRIDDFSSNGFAAPPDLEDAWSLISFDRNVEWETNAVRTISGRIANASGQNIFLGGIHLFVSPSSSESSYKVRWADEFLATDGVIPTSGYEGPILVVECLPRPALGSTATAHLTLLTDSPVRPTEVFAECSLTFKLQRLVAVRSQNTIVISWPAEGSSLVLHRSDNIDDPEWVPVESPVQVKNGRCEVTLPQDLSATFYSLFN